MTHSLISFGRNFLVFLRTALYPYAFKRARVYQVLASIFYCVSAARGSAAASLPFLVGCRGRGTWRGAAGSPLWRRTSFPCHPGTWRMQWVYGSVCLRHGKCGCSRPTINGQCSDLLFGWCTVHQSFYYKSCRFLCGRCRHVHSRHPWRHIIYLVLRVTAS